MALKCRKLAFRTESGIDQPRLPPVAFEYEFEPAGVTSSVKRNGAWQQSAANPAPLIPTAGRVRNGRQSIPLRMHGVPPNCIVGCRTGPIVFRATWIIRF